MEQATQSPLQAVMRNGDFQKLWIAQILSQTAFHVINFALITQIFAFSASSLAVSFLVLAIGAPAVCFGILAGAYVDRWNRKYILVLTNVLRAIGVLGYFFVGHWLIGLYVITFFISLVTQFFAPAESAVLPQIVGRNNIMQAQSLFLFTMYGSFILGYSVAGPLQHVGGEQFPFTVAFFFYLTASILVAFLPRLPHKKAAAETVETVWGQMQEGLSTIRRTHKIWFPIIQLSIAQGITTAVFVLAPAFAQGVLGISVRDASFIMVAPAGLGILSGVILMGRYGKRFAEIKLISVATLVSGFALLFVALANGSQRVLEQQVLNGHHPILERGVVSLPKFINLISVVGVGIFILGVSISIITISSQTLLQKSTGPQMRGRVFGVLNMLVSIAGTLPVLVIGAIADISSVEITLAALAIGLVSWGVLAPIVSPKNGRKKVLTPTETLVE